MWIEYLPSFASGLKQIYHLYKIDLSDIFVSVSRFGDWRVFKQTKQCYGHDGRNLKAILYLCELGFITALTSIEILCLEIHVVHFCFSSYIFVMKRLADNI